MVIPSYILRQHPPPHPRGRSVVGPNENDTGQTAYCLTRCEERKGLLMSINASSLPDDAWIEILSRLPAQDVFELARLVCWKWCRMIHTRNFINTNLQNTPYGLLFKCRDFVSFFVTMQQGQIEFSELRHWFFSSMIWSSCNGLSVMCELLDEANILYIVNPVTKKVFVLPPTNYPLLDFELCSIGYASASMEYKVVITQTCFGDIYAWGWGILTPGVDSSWRVVRTDHIPFLATGAGTISYTPLITEGFMHWPLPDGNEVLSLDLETEILTMSYVPISYRFNEQWSYLSTGRYLSLLITGGGFLWQVWEMKNPGEWRKLDGVVIDLGTQMLRQFKGFNLHPVGWLKYLEVLVFRFYQPCRNEFFQNVLITTFIYNLLTKEISPFELPHAPFCCSPIAHKNSLAWLA